MYDHHQPLKTEGLTVYQYLRRPTHSSVLLGTAVRAAVALTATVRHFLVASQSRLKFASGSLH